MEREKREGKKGKGGRREVAISHERTHTHTSLKSDSLPQQEKEGSGELCI